MPDIDEEFEESNEGFASLRKAHKAAKKELEEAKAQLAAYKANETKANLEKVFKEQGLKPQLAGLYSAEDQSPEAVTAWAKQYGFVPEPLDEESTPDPVQLTDEQRAAQNVQSIGSLGTPGGTPSLQEQLAKASTPEEWEPLLEAAGMLRRS